MDKYNQLECEQAEILEEILKFSDGLKMEDKEECLSFLPVTITQENGCIKITIKSVLPHEKNLITYRTLKTIWCESIVPNLREFCKKHNMVYEKVTIKIIAYLPKSYIWDVDNRAYSMIINAVRRAGIVKDDNYKNVQVVLTGNVDKENPRTEVYIQKYQ